MDHDALEDIRRLKYRYFRSLDLKEWDAFGDCLTADVRARYGTKAAEAPLHFDTRDDVVAYMSQNLPATMLTTHVASHPDIAVDGDTATASWVFEDTVLSPEFKVLIRGSGYYADEYRREDDGQWRISATSYRRMFEYLISLDDLPSFTLLAPHA